MLRVAAALGAQSVGATAPAAPSNNQAAATSSTAISQTWVDNSGNETGFEAQRDTSPTFASPTTDSSIAANVTSKSWTGLTASTTYYTRVRATNAEGNSAWSNTASATTPASGSPPAAPSGNSVTTDSASQLTMNWTDNSANEDDFEAQRADDAAFTVNLTTAVKAANSTSHAWTGLTEGKQYHTRVRARNATGNSNWSNTAAGYTQLATPTSFNGQDKGSFVRFTWLDNSSKEANYEIHKDAALHATLAANTVQYDIAEPNDAGTWKVRAVHGTIPDSDFSNEKTGPPWPE